MSWVRTVVKVGVSQNRFVKSEINWPISEHCPSDKWTIREGRLDMVSELDNRAHCYGAFLSSRPTSSPVLETTENNPRVETEKLFSSGNLMSVSLT